MRGAAERIKSIDATLKEMFLAMLTVGLLAQFILVWFVQDKAGFSVGLWVGVVTAAFMANNMNSTLERALTLGEGGAQTLIRKNSILRYFAVIIVLIGSYFTGWVNPFAVFGGIMTLKVSAYLQPLTHKILERLRR